MKYLVPNLFIAIMTMVVISLSCGLIHPKIRVDQKLKYVEDYLLEKEVEEPF